MFDKCFCWKGMLLSIFIEQKTLYFNQTFQAICIIISYPLINDGPQRDKNKQIMSGSNSFRQATTVNNVQQPDYVQTSWGVWAVIARLNHAKNETKKLSLFLPQLPKQVQPPKLYSVSLTQARQSPYKFQYANSNVYFKLMFNPLLNDV